MLPSARLAFRHTLRRSTASSPAGGVHDRSKTIGFIGLGAMGKEMANNLLTKTMAANSDPAVTFVVHDTFEQSITRFLTANTSLHPKRNIIAASSPAGIAKLSGTIVTMLPSSPQVEQVYTQENGILEGLESHASSNDPQASTLCIDCTTLDPAVAVETAAKIKNANSHGVFDMIDAPVSGGVVGANAGTLSFMVGSDSTESFQRAEPYLSLMGSRTIHCGKNGNGLIAKIANNLLLGISMLGVTEAMLLGTAHGLPPSVLAGIINTSTGKCWSSEVNNPCPGALEGTKYSPPADRDYEGGFAARLMAKDLKLAMNTAKLEGVPTPLGQLTASIYEALGGNDEYMNKDFAVAFKALQAAVGREEFRQGREKV
ncbi:3-hydroxyisobutyrate dehydrogenase [Moesziomyces antarcticus]|uniref:3-hydroxyisobutyrate dehydrogenase n=2 Tax=Pseudozyma antarctica TaxID=84753 RepID=A0A081CF33_PSEA2|nr:3-hydroxyisobutyrate dehydrogenase [Moesziomyces antarcticus]GAK65279.1 3-hydroxyisobutyrate dehydrogenase [Moesziomyces antarcticus]SPO46286.1 probable 3-hydroxyisobutyrate dehydrogenase, mitochondrial precursor [Moesziomyces antarcticus]